MLVAMRVLLGATALFSFGSAAAAQDVKPVNPAPSKPAAAPADPFAGIPPAKPSDVASIDAIMAAVYDVISGDAGVERNWLRFRSLFYPGARMIPTGRNAKTGHVAAVFITPEAYIRSNGPFLTKQGFHEREIHRHVDTFGNIAQVFSSYEARHKLGDEKPFLRGINSIQLFNDGKRWWVLTIAWSAENEQNPLPEEYSKRRGS
jgi:hypothetical protein